MPPRSRRAAHELALRCLSKDEVSDDDVLSVLRLWHFKANKIRVNVMPEGTTSVFSDTLGLVKTRVGKILCGTATSKYWAVIALFARWLAEHLPRRFATLFAFSSILMNFAYGAKPHRDAFNLGPSIVSIGRETMGMTRSRTWLVHRQINSMPDAN